jgi:hypothetical protein
MNRYHFGVSYDYKGLSIWRSEDRVTANSSPTISTLVLEDMNEGEFRDLADALNRIIASPFKKDPLWDMVYHIAEQTQEGLQST